MAERNRRLDAVIEQALPGHRTRRDDVDELLALTEHPDERVRARAVQNLCPCHVTRDVDDVWRRIMAMSGDGSVRVRRMVVHALGDGSPKRLAEEIIPIFETLAHDDDKVIRKSARRVLTAYRRTGRINVL